VLSIKASLLLTILSAFLLGGGLLVTPSAEAAKEIVFLGCMVTRNGPTGVAKSGDGTLVALDLSHVPNTQFSLKSDECYAFDGLLLDGQAPVIAGLPTISSMVQVWTINTPDKALPKTDGKEDTVNPGSEGNDKP